LRIGRGRSNQAQLGQQKNQQGASKPLDYRVSRGIITGSLSLAGPGVGQIQVRRHKASLCGAWFYIRREIEGETANPGTAGPDGYSGRNAGSAPEHREHEVLGDGWPFRVSGIWTRCWSAFRGAMEIGKSRATISPYLSRASRSAPTGRQRQS
jgi:hypothetical protein